jgi:hypothetical protein
LRIFEGLDLKNTLFVDNEPMNLINQIENLVPIMDFKPRDDEDLSLIHDNELRKLADYLVGLADREGRDLAESNSRHFKFDAIKATRM